MTMQANGAPRWVRVRFGRSECVFQRAQGGRWEDVTPGVPYRQPAVSDLEVERWVGQGAARELSLEEAAALGVAPAPHNGQPPAQDAPPGPRRAGGRTSAPPEASEA